MQQRDTCCSGVSGEVRSVDAMEVDDLHEGMECNVGISVAGEQHLTKGDDVWYKLHYVLNAMTRIA